MNPEPSVPGLDFAFRIRAEIGPVASGGMGIGGERLHIPISGGSVEGKCLIARILPGGFDWPLIRHDGNSVISAKYTIETSDGALIMVTNRGLRVSPSEVLARLRSRETVRADEYYFRTVVEFDAPDGPHAWLRESLFVGTAAPQAGAVVIDVYRVS